MIRISEISDRPAASPDCARLLHITEEENGLDAYLALDRLLAGPAFGGIRRRRYASREEARREVLHLARGMGRKLSFAGLDVAGAKAVILDAPGLEAEGLYDALGRALAELGPLWVAGPDLGTDAADLDVLRRHSDQVNDAANDAGLATARGVFRGLEAGLEAHFGSPSLVDRRALIQGVGAVGAALAGMVNAAGAELTVSELDPRRVADLLAAEQGLGRRVAIQAPDDLLGFSGDLAMPCAAGGFIDTRLAAHLDVRLICGSANEQLSSEGLDRILHDRGVLMLPDFTVNAGAVIEGVVIHQEGESGRARAETLIEETRGRVAALLASARNSGRTPLESALLSIGEGRP